MIHAASPRTRHRWGHSFGFRKLLSGTIVVVAERKTAGMTSPSNHSLKIPIAALRCFAVQSFTRTAGRRRVYEERANMCGVRLRIGFEFHQGEDRRQAGRG